MRIKGSESAYPFRLDPQDSVYEENYGLTKREYFAAMALQGLMANRTPDIDLCTSVADFAVYHADALIEALNKKEEK